MYASAAPSPRNIVPRREMRRGVDNIATQEARLQLTCENGFPLAALVVGSTQAAGQATECECTNRVATPSHWVSRLQRQPSRQDVCATSELSPEEVEVKRHLKLLTSMTCDALDGSTGTPGPAGVLRNHTRECAGAMWDETHRGEAGFD
jgi:hypothetical protein